MRDAAATLAEAVDCLRAQQGVSLQVVAVDDGSSDDSLAMLRQLATGWPALEVIAASAAGVPAALERARASATAPWLGRMDADDRCSPHRFRALLDRAQDDGRRVDVIGSRIEGFGRTSASMDAYLRWQNGLLDHDDLVRNRFVESPLAHATALLRADKLAEVGGWDPAATWSEDMDLWCRLAAAGARFTKLPEVLYQWRLHPTQATRVDPRCAPDAMRACKVHYLARGPLAGRRVVLWSVGRTLELWREALTAAECEVRAEALSPRALGGRECTLPATAAGEVVLAVYGAPTARERIGALFCGDEEDLWFAA